MIRILLLPISIKLTAWIFLVIARIYPLFLKVPSQKGLLSPQRLLRLKLEEALYQIELLTFANKMLQQKLREVTKQPHLNLKEKLSLALTSLLPLHNPAFLKEIFPVKWKTIKNWASSLKAGRVNDLLPASRRPQNSPLKTPEEIETLVCRMKRENPLWGYVRITGELRSLGISIHRSTVRRILIRHRLIPPSLQMCLEWMKIITFKPNDMWAMDVFRARLWGIIPVYLCFILDDYSRLILGFSVSFIPTTKWIITCLKETIDYYGHPLSLLTDNGYCFRSSFDALLISKEIIHKRCSVRHPQTNGKIERLWRSIKEELLSRTLIVSTKNLIWLLNEYITYYNNFRPHQGIKNSIPLDKLNDREKVISFYPNNTRIKRIKFAGGLLSSYVLKEAA